MNAQTDKATIDPLDVSQWRFYILPTSVLSARTRSQHSIALRTLEKQCGPGCSFGEVAEAVTRIVGVGGLAITMRRTKVQVCIEDKRRGITAPLLSPL
jgi:hypothetical protein